MTQPVSLRFYYVVPLGLGSGSSVIIGDSVVWADPEKDFRSLVPAVPMLWAAFAMVRPPAEDASVLGTQLVDSLRHTRRLVWRVRPAGGNPRYNPAPPPHAGGGGRGGGEGGTPGGGRGGNGG